MIKDCFKPAPLSARASTGLLVLRLVAGLAFMFHGWGKIQHPFSWMGPESGTPGIFQGLAALSEFGGGLAWILGLLTPLASLGIACTMAMAVRLHMLVIGDPFVASKQGQGSYELAALYLAMAVMFILTGPGRWSADRTVFGQKEH
jgi:putative oxidoreductase